MKTLKAIISLILLAKISSGQSISSYKQYLGWAICKSNSKEVVILRSFWKENRPYYFIVNPKTLNTAILQSDSLILTPSSWESLSKYYKSTTYIMALKQSQVMDSSIRDAGFKHFNSAQNGIDLTIDLCPSKLPLDRVVFNEIIADMGQVEKPVPLSISITGIWLNKHLNDIQWLDSLVKVGELSIIWINHSYNHRTYKNVPLSKNFMLATGTDINGEVMNTEIDLIANKIVPSIFFRFPGLISDQAVYDKVCSLGLIPIGSDAWLAKGQQPIDGSIVLIHANGNEPLGIRRFIKLLKNKQKEILNKQWELYDLRESFIEDTSTQRK